MMTKKKRQTVLIGIIILVLLICVLLFILIYLNTDMFKSNKTLFAKYLGENLDNINSLEEIFSLTEYDEQLANNPYNEEIELRVNYTQDIGTTAENNDNNINQLIITLEGQTDNNNQYDYRNVNLLNNNEQTMQVELLHTYDNYGIRFSDLFNQYIVVENTNLKELFEKIGYTDEQLENIPDSITLNEEILDEFKFSDEEIESLKEKYVEIISQSLSNDNFQKQSNQIITINGQNYTTNAYILTLTKEQLNNIYINILESIEDDEIIIAKIENLQNKIDELTLGNNNLNLKETLINKIDKQIQLINQSNIGSDETRIIVYTSEGETIRTSIETEEYQINLDFIQTESETFLELLVVENGSEIYQITLKNTSSSLNVTIQDNNEDSTFSLERTQQINNQTRDENYSLIYEIDDQKVNVRMSRSTEIIQTIENQQSFDDENAVMLNSLEDNQVQEILDRVKTGLDYELEIVREEIEYQDIEEMLVNLGLIQNTNILESDGITETEKNRYNSTFELLQGENLSGENVSRAIQTISSNIGDLEVVSDTELRLNIVRSEGNEEIVETLTTFLDEKGNNEYNISLEYDEDGLVSQFIITIVEDE